MYSMTTTTTDLDAVFGTVAAAFGIWVLILLGFGIVMGVLTHKLAGHKGYRGYFWTGFFLGIVGLIYVVGLPLKNEQQ